VIDLVQQATDDQLALAICLASVVSSGLVMYFSRYVGRLTARAPVSQHSPQVVPPVPALQDARRGKAA
jgi:hypothetical protein